MATSIKKTISYLAVLYWYTLYRKKYMDSSRLFSSALQILYYHFN